jgi:hypothetical protein
MDKGVILFSFENYKGRFFIPSKKNYFQGLEIPYVMFDSGCNSSLLPLTLGQVKDLYNRFPLSNGYRWSLGGFNGVASLQSPTLRIKSSGSLMQAQLATDANGPSIDFPYLRFHLCLEDVLDLLSLTPSPLDTIEIGLLKDFVEMVASIKKNYPSLKIAQRRSHALFGQWFLNKFPSIQIGSVCMLVDAKFDWTNATTIASNMEKYSQRLVKTIAEFNDLEDDDHDKDDECTLKYELIDE